MPSASAFAASNLAVLLLTVAGKPIYPAGDPGVPYLPYLPHLPRLPWLSSDAGDASDPWYELGRRREQLVVELRLLRNLGSKCLLWALRVAPAGKCSQRSSQNE